MSSAPATTYAHMVGHAEGAVEEEGEQEADDERAEEADVLEHLAERQALLRAASDCGMCWPRNIRP